MRTILFVTILVLLALAVPATPAHAGGVVSVCDEAHLLAALAAGGTVTFACSGTIILTAEIVIGSDTTIDGSGQNVAISGNHAVRVFIVNSGVALSVNEISITQGYYEGRGGGIRNHGTLSVSNSTFSGNTGRTGGGIFNDYDSTVTVSNSTFVANSGRSGGGISSYGTLTVDHSTFSANTASGGGGGSGGGIASSGTGIVSNSTFSGNSSPYGGGIFNGRVLTVSNSTFSGNSSSNGGGISNWHILTVRNTIVATSPTGNNCHGGVITDGGGNLSYPDTTCPGINADPILGLLQNNGGPTETMALGWGSAALDAADDAICAADPINNLDQRGVTRPKGLHCDIGAVEQEPYPSLPSRMWVPVVYAR